jgi:hypothetical protein
MPDIKALISFLSGGALAPARQHVNGLRIALGDNLQQVQKALAVQSLPVPAANSKNQVLRVEGQGVRVTFNHKGRVCNLRLARPFRGSVGGVRIGDKQAVLEKSLGTAKEQGKVRRMSDGHLYDSFLYDLDKNTTARFGLDAEGHVDAIFVSLPE